MLSPVVLLVTIPHLYEFIDYRMRDIRNDILPDMLHRH